MQKQGTTEMLAMSRSRYGGPEVLSLAPLNEREPGPHEVLVQVHAASVSAADLHLLHGTPAVARVAFGLFRPRHRTPGTDMAGVVLRTGSQVASLKPGDRVFGDLSSSGFGSWGQQVSVKADLLARIPDGVSFQAAAATPVSAVTALQGLRDKGKLQAGQHVLVTGASGGVGSMAVQIAISMGATVTALTSTPHLQAVSGLGATTVIDRNEKDVTQWTERFDVILDCAAFHPLARIQKLLAPGGRYVFVGGGSSQTIAALMSGKGMLATPSRSDLEQVAALLASGQLVPLIDSTYTLQQAADAVRRFSSGQASGKVLITMNPA